MATTDPDAFAYDGGIVPPGTTSQFKYQVSQTYLGDPVRIPITIVNGVEPGPTVFLSAALHGDELNGIAVVREVAQRLDHSHIHGTVICLPVLNVLGFVTQQRYLPIFERDLNRAFPGKRGSTSANRIAYRIYTNFIQPCDFGIDFHTSTRGRTNMFHVRADMERSEINRLARSFGTNLIVSGPGSPGMLRREATNNGIPTITVEMGEAHRFERDLIDHALEGIRSVFAEFGIDPQESVRWPGWTTVVEGGGEKTWLRADSGGIVEMKFSKDELVYEGDTICTISSPFERETTAVTAPFTGILVGILENPVVYPGNPLCHLVYVDSQTQYIIENYQ